MFSEAGVGVHGIEDYHGPDPDHPGSNSHFGVLVGVVPM